MISETVSPSTASLFPKPKRASLVSSALVSGTDYLPMLKNQIVEFQIQKSMVQVALGNIVVNSEIKL